MSLGQANPFFSRACPRSSLSQAFLSCGTLGRKGSLLSSKRSPLAGLFSTFNIQMWLGASKSLEREHMALPEVI